ncbi:hypothetical protein ED236_07570 [Pseudomethylobacillus aquaticus]|uniref:Uncharacterized protein n=1 Tax=Pseudomethylobacillus aquaticus TaxID=2676064 RepID=A0A3N0V0F2_9PROT|nr:hypothetical protein ED236_07570 [Pseudomethylobacillus aquaticus]
MRQTIYGKGAEAYQTATARRLYALSLLKLADKFFWAPLAVLVATAFTVQLDALAAQLFIAVVLCVTALFLRDQGLKIIDAIPKKAKKAQSTARLKSASARKKSNAEKVDPQRAQPTPQADGPASGGPTA